MLKQIRIQNGSGLELGMGENPDWYYLGYGMGKNTNWIFAGIQNGGKSGADLRWSTEWGKTWTGFQLDYGMGQNLDWISTGMQNGGKVFQCSPFQWQRLQEILEDQGWAVRKIPDWIFSLHDG